MSKNKKTMFPVSVIVPMRNSETTILQTLDSIIKQKYPVKEIIIINNVSSDNSVKLVQEFTKRSKIPIILINRKENFGVGASYNVGAKKACALYIVFIHSDSTLPTQYELEKLTQPFRLNSEVIATYPTRIHPEEVWETYNFWQKCQFAQAVGVESPGMNGKFDCLNKEIFLSIGGFDEVTYGKDVSIGGEDADLYLRLKEKGEIVLSSAKVIHLHYMGDHFKLSDWIKTRKLLARTYGRLIRFKGNSLPLMTYGSGLSIPLGVLIFLVKPILAIIPFIPFFQIPGLLLLIIYGFLNSKKLYITRSTITNPRIILLPLIDIFLVYYETFWMIEAFFFVKKGYNKVIV